MKWEDIGGLWSDDMIEWNFKNNVLGNSVQMEEFEEFQYIQNLSHHKVLHYCQKQLIIYVYVYVRCKKSIHTILKIQQQVTAGLKFRSSFFNFVYGEQSGSQKNLTDRCFYSRLSALLYLLQKFTYMVL